MTVPQHLFTPYLPAEVEYIKGQLEQGGGTNYLHWQVLVSFKVKVTLTKVRSVFGSHHAELTRSAAVERKLGNYSQVELLG